MLRKQETDRKEEQNSCRGSCQIYYREAGADRKCFCGRLYFSIVAMCFVNVNYDLTKYVPSYTQSSQGLDKMKEEFGYPGTARLMIKDVSLYEAKNIRISWRQ